MSDSPHGDWVRGVWVVITRCVGPAKGLRGLNARPEGSCAQAGHTTGPANGGSKLIHQRTKLTGH